MNVPLLDLTKQYASVADEVNEAIRTVVEEQRFILGPTVDAFEREVEEHLGIEHAVGCASGTDAILLALRALDIAPGAEVVTSPFTFFATAGAVHNVGARPVFATLVSTGMPGAATATHKGTFRIWVKLLSSTMDNIGRPPGATRSPI